MRARHVACVLWHLMAPALPTNDALSADCDPLLRPFLLAQTETEREKHLIALIEEEAGPVMQRVLRGKFRGSIGSESDFEDVFSSARGELISHLESLREGTRTESIGGKISRRWNRRQWIRRCLRSTR